MELLKRFSLDLNGRIIAAFDTLGEALAFEESHNMGPGLVTLWDHEDKEPIYTNIRI